MHGKRMYVMGCLALSLAGIAIANDAELPSAAHEPKAAPKVSEVARDPMLVHKDFVESLLLRLRLPPELQHPRNELPTDIPWPTNDANQAAFQLANLRVRAVIPFMVENLVAYKSIVIYHPGDKGYLYSNLLIANFEKEGADAIIADCKRPTPRDDEWMEIAGYDVACCYGLDEAGKAIALAIVDRECERETHEREPYKEKLLRLRKAIGAAKGDSGR